MKKIVLGLTVFASMFIGVNSSSAHDLASAGSESKGWLYSGVHWPSTSTNFFEATTDTWETRFDDGIKKFTYETRINFSINKVAVGKTENFIEDYGSSSANWVARVNVYGTSNDHPNRWRMQFNSSKSSVKSWPTIAAHEIGHIFGLDDLYETYNSDVLMYGRDSGERTIKKVDNDGFNYVYK